MKRKNRIAKALSRIEMENLAQSVFDAINVARAGHTREDDPEAWDAMDQLEKAVRDAMQSVS